MVLRREVGVERGLGGSRAGYDLVDANGVDARACRRARRRRRGCDRAVSLWAHQALPSASQIHEALMTGPVLPAWTPCNHTDRPVWCRSEQNRPVCMIASERRNGEVFPGTTSGPCRSIVSREGDQYVVRIAPVRTKTTPATHPRRHLCPRPHPWRELLGARPGDPTPATEDNSQPAPPSIGADIPLTYFGPAPSNFDPELVGPHQLLRSGTLDTTAGTITLPLYQGQIADGRSVWYILTDTNDKGNADALGLNYSAKLTYAAVGNAIRTATLEKDATLTFNAGTVDFSPERTVVPGDGANPFPPQTVDPGSVGDADYSPLVEVTNAGGFIYNAPIVAFDVDRRPARRLLRWQPRLLPGARQGPVDLPQRADGDPRPHLRLQLRQAGPLPEHRVLRRGRRHAGRRDLRSCPARHHRWPRRQRLQRAGADLRDHQRSDRRRAIPSARGSTPRCSAKGEARSTSSAVFPPSRPTTARSGTSISASGRRRRSTRAIAPA